MRRKKRLTTSLMRIGLIPLLGFGLLVLVITSGIIYSSLRNEVYYSLEVLADATHQAYGLIYPGDYSEEDGVLRKGSVDVSDWIHMMDERKAITGADYTLFYGDTRYLTTIKDAYGNRVNGTKAEKEVIASVLEKNEPFYSDKVLVNGEPYFGYYKPVENLDGTVIGMFFTGKPRAEVMKNINHNIFVVCFLEIGTMLVMMAFIAPFSRRLVTALHKMEKFLEEVAQGNLMAEMDADVLKRADEIGEMGRFAVVLQKSIMDLVGKDPLTGLQNRRSCDVVLRNLTEGDGRTIRNFTVVMADIDLFKCVNDKYGHQTGDAILKMTAELMREHMEHLGFVFRWGGEEFLLIYEDMGEDETKTHLEKLQNQIREARILCDDDIVRITMTFGMAEYHKEKKPEILVALADENLYYGKNHGRDCIVGTKEGIIEREERQQ